MSGYTLQRELSSTWVQKIGIDGCASQLWRQKPAGKQCQPAGSILIDIANF
jgi:hypothetical protein